MFLWFPVLDLARAPRRTARKKGSGYENVWERDNLVPRACDPREGNEGSGIIRFREDSDWPLKWMRSSILATIPGFRQRIIPEPSFPSQGSQARGTRLGTSNEIDSKAFSSPEPFSLGHSLKIRLWFTRPNGKI